MDNITNFTFFLAIVSTILFTFGITAFLTVFFMEKKGRFENPERLQKLRGVVSKLMLGFIPFLILTLILLIIGFQDVDSIDNSMSIFKDFFDSFGILPLDTLSALFGLDGDYLIVSVCFVFSLYLLLVLAYFLFHCFLVHSIIRKFPEVSVLLITKDKLRSFKDDIDSNPDIVYFIESEEKIERGGNAFFLQDLGSAVFRVLVDVFVAHDVYGSRQTDRSHAGNLFLRDGINGVHLVGIQRRCAGHA